MCVATLAGGEFDPEQCPLLAGLSERERKRRMAQPWLQDCIARRKARLAAAGAGLPAVIQDCPAIEPEGPPADLTPVAC